MHGICSLLLFLWELFVYICDYNYEWTDNLFTLLYWLSEYSDKYIIQLNQDIPKCVNCDNPVKEPDEIIKINNTAFESGAGEVDASKAA